MGREELERQLVSPDPETRRQAAARLGAAGVDNPVPLIVRALGDADWRVRKEATAVAIQLAPAPDLLQALLLTLEPGENVGLRNAAVEAIAGFGSAGVSALAAALPELDADGRKLAAEALAQSGQAGAIGCLQSLVGDADSNVRVAAIEAISAVGSTCLELAVATLESCLGADEQLVKLSALDGLNRLNAAVSWDKLEPLIDDPILAPSALSAAGRCGSPRAAEKLALVLQNAKGRPWSVALQALAELLRSAEPLLRATCSALSALPQPVRARVLEQAGAGAEQVEIRRSALLVAGALGSEEAAAAAVEALQDDRVAAEAEEALALLGTRAVPVLAAHASSGDPEQRAMCIELLSRLTNPPLARVAAEAVSPALLDPSTEVVRAALAALGRLGDENNFERIAERLSGEPPVRKAAEAALYALSQRHPAFARRFVQAARPEGVQGHAAAVIMGALGSPEHAATDAEFLSVVLSNESAAARRAAVEALATMTTAGAVEAVAFAIADEEREVQHASVRALGRMRREDGSAAGLEHLLDLVQSSQDAALVAAAIRALGDTAEPRALHVLRQLARAGHPMAAVAAVEALGQLPGPRRIEGLIDALSHADGEVVKAALRELAVEADPRALAHLGACLDHEAWDVRRLAADLLALSGGSAAIGLLRAKLPLEPEPLVKEALVRALSELESASGLVRSTNPPPRRGSWPPR